MVVAAAAPTAAVVDDDDIVAVVLADGQATCKQWLPVLALWHVSRARKRHTYGGIITQLPNGP